jgi:hypothetical protein
MSRFYAKGSDSSEDESSSDEEVQVTTKPQPLTKAVFVSVPTSRL